jgi:nuclear pore complex protein Nup62
MDEIVNKWTQELETATKEFSRQAAEVAAWDGVLRKGGNEISKLLHALQVAEERQASIEQTLDYVEQQQTELISLLESNETQVAELLEGSALSGIASYGGGKSLRSNLETGAADAERERAYALAESLNAQLDELSRNLSSMIVEVNNLTSSTAANASRHNAEADPASLRVAGRVNQDADSDPVSQIVSILSAHLGSLKWIDESAAELRSKLENLRRGQIGGTAEARSTSTSKRGDLSSTSPVVRHRGDSAAPSSERQGSLGPESIRAGSIGPGYVRATSVGRNAGTGWSENTVAMGGGSNLGRSRGYGL